MKILSVLTAFASFLASTDAFAAPRFAVLPRSTTLRFSQAAAIDLEDETMYRYILAKAKECAFSDSATAKEAKDYLNKILELESGCISGVLAAHDICDNIDEMADVVAHLREKVDKGIVFSPQQASATWTMAALVSISLFFAFLAETQWQKEVTPFTLQEWMWAMKGGYLDVMVSHFIRNGGL